MGYFCFSSQLVSAPSSSASPGVSLVQISSMAIMYASMGVFGVMAKFGPLDSSEFSARVSSLDDKLMTHLLLKPVDVTLGTIFGKYQYFIRLTFSLGPDEVAIV